MGFAMVTKEEVRAVAAQQETDLPQLTPQQMHFVEGLLEGKPASEAYRAAYNAAGMQLNTIWASASVLSRNPKIAVWLAAAREAGLGAAVVTLAGHVRELERLRELSIKSGNMAAATQAEQLRGKAMGLYVERYENITPHDPVKVLIAMAKIKPEYAKAVAAAHGISWDKVLDALPAVIELRAEKVDPPDSTGL